MSEKIYSEGTWRAVQDWARALGVDIDRQVGGPEDKTYQVVWMESFDPKIEAKGVEAFDTLQRAVDAVADTFGQMLTTVKTEEEA